MRVPFFLGHPVQQFIDFSHQNVMAHEISFAQATDSSTPFKSRSIDSSASLEHQFNTFKVNIESKVAALLTKIAEQSQIIDKNNQELCKLTEENLHLKSRLSDLEEKVFPKGESTILVHPDNNVTHTGVQTGNFQSTNSSEMIFTKLFIHRPCHKSRFRKLWCRAVFPLAPQKNVIESHHLAVEI